MVDATAKALMLFDRHVEMPPAELSHALIDLQQQDAEVYGALMLLLAADEKTHSFVSPLAWFAGQNRPDADGPPVVNPIWPNGTRLGPWSVDGVIGLGGMGVVYAGHRADDLYEREVALKTIRAEIMSPALQQAFAKERSHLAKLDHPCIVSLYDAGIVDDGLPWLVMQRVYGDPVDEWCDTRKADLRTRVGLLIDTCDAIAYAHAHGVLHQDIKPSNLLVTAEGQVKLLDFGLSAIVTPQGDTGFTRVGVSSAYAAPEVFEGAPPSVAIDVYALGVVLYRLLCGGWPRRPQAMVALQGADDVALNPSRLAIDAGNISAAAHGAADAQALFRALSGDLDAIALRCTHCDPAARYASVSDLRDDLQAWLDRRPVAASGGGCGYRFVRFIRRNAVTAGVAVVLVTVLATSGAMAWRQQQRTKVEAENGEILSQLFEKSLGVATLTSLGSAPLSSRTLLIDTERRLRTQAGDGRVLLLARGLTTLSRAQLIGGNYAEAARLAEEAKALGSDFALQRARADAVLAQLSNMRANYAQTERIVREGLSMVPSEKNVGEHLVRLDLQMQLARARWGRGDPKSAFATLDSAVASAAALGEDGLPALAELLGQRGYMRTQLFQLEDAQADLQRALKVLGDRSPTVQNTLRRYLANVLLLSGAMQEAYLQASASLESNLRIFGPSHPETGRAWVVVGKVLFYLEKPDRSEDAIGRAMRILEPQIGEDHPDLADAIVLRGALALEKDDLDGAFVNARRALDILERAYGPHHEAALKRRTDLASLLLMRADKVDARQRDALYREADQLLSDAIGAGQRQGLPMGYARDEYANVLLHFGRIREAESQVHQAITEMSDLFANKDSDYVLPAYMSLMRVRSAQGHHDEATDIGARLLATEENKSPYTRFTLLVMLLDNEIARGDPERIRGAYDEVKTFAEEHGFMEALRSKRVPGISSQP